MKFLSAILAILLVPVSALAQEGKLKIATVDIQLLYNSYHRTEKLQKEVNAEKAKIQQQVNERMVRIREIETQLQNADKQLRDPSIADSRKEVIARDGSAKRDEGVALDRERRDFEERRTLRLKEMIFASRGAIIGELSKLVEERARTEDFDFVFDKSGLSSNQIPFFLYGKETHDLTDEILAAINKQQPSETGAGETKGK